MLTIKFLRLHSLHPLGDGSSRSYIMVLSYDFGIAVALKKFTERYDAEECRNLILRLRN